MKVEFLDAAIWFVVGVGFACAVNFIVRTMGV